MPTLSSRLGVKVAAFKEHRFDSLIPEVISDMDTDVEYQEMIRKTKERGQAALTRDENSKRQAVLRELDIVPWKQKMQVSCTVGQFQSEKFPKGTRSRLSSVPGPLCTPEHRGVAPLRYKGPSQPNQRFIWSIFTTHTQVLVSGSNAHACKVGVNSNSTATTQLRLTVVRIQHAPTFMHITSFRCYMCAACTRASMALIRPI